MRTFTKLREMLSNYKELRDKIAEIEKKQDHQFKIVFNIIQMLVEAKDTKAEEKPLELPPQRPIGFKSE